MKRSHAKRAGLAFVLLYFFMAIICIVLAGLMFQFTAPNFKNWAWQHLSALEVASIAYVFFCSFLGFAAFAHPRVGILTAYIIFTVLSLIFTLAIAVFTLIAGSTGFLNVFFGCNAFFTGMMNIWMGMDNYLLNADMYLCSADCPCFIQNTTPYTSNPFVAPAFNQWTVTQNNLNAVNFQGCSQAVHTNVYTAANAASPDFFNPNGDFNAANFWAYMANIENRFSCTGFCQINYLNAFTNQPTQVSKYLFTDVNRGPPAAFGCLDIFLNWVPSYLLAFGSVAMVLFFFQLLSLIMAGALCHHRRGDVHNDVVVVTQKEVIVERPAVAYERPVVVNGPAVI